MCDAVVLRGTVLRSVQLRCVVWCGDAKEDDTRMHDVHRNGDAHGDIDGLEIVVHHEMCSKNEHLRQLAAAHLNSV